MVNGNYHVFLWLWTYIQQRNTSTTKCVPVLQSCLDSVLSDKAVYSTFARTVPGTSEVSKSVLTLFKSLNWNSFALIKENTTEWHEISWTLNKVLEGTGITVCITHTSM